MLALQGPSGSGKTTLLLLAAARCARTAAACATRGRDLAGFSERDAAQYLLSEVGLIAQRPPHLMAHVSAVENTATKLLLGGVPLPEAHERALRSLEQVGMGERTRRTPQELSGGERQRVVIARALAAEPQADPRRRADREPRQPALPGDRRAARPARARARRRRAARHPRRGGHRRRRQGAGAARRAHRGRDAGGWPRMSRPAQTGLVTRRLLGRRTLVYFYRRRLRAHGVQEMLAGVGSRRRSRSCSPRASRRGASPDRPARCCGP